MPVTVSSPGRLAGVGISAALFVASGAPVSPLAMSTVAPVPVRGRLVVHGTGDVNLDPSYIPALAARGYDHAWSGLNGLFAADDLTVVNLECPVSDRGAAVSKEFTFRCDPAALPAAPGGGCGGGEPHQQPQPGLRGGRAARLGATAAEQRHRAG
jgi:Bacterial capsule synthesis protein PGA_cap